MDQKDGGEIVDKVERLERIAFNIRKNIIQTIINNGEGHAGGALSCVDILAVLFFSKMNVDTANLNSIDNDKFILSAGHKCLALYSALIERGILNKNSLNTYNKLYSSIPGHPNMKSTPGIDFSTGSLGHGLSIGCGFSKASKMLKLNNITYVLMGDGEQAEGSVWESAIFSVHHQLDNLVAIVDRNGLQVGGSTKQVMGEISLEDCYKSLGWSVRVIDGHNIRKIEKTLQIIPFEEKKPSMIICNTIKGKGLSFIENKHTYHHWNPTREEAHNAISELQAVATARGWTI